MANSLSFTLPALIKTKLPPLPGTVARISAMLQDINVSQRALADAISIDPMLASRILRLANSPIYSMRNPVSNLIGAVSTIGNRSIYELVVVNAASETFGQEIHKSVIGREIWFHSLGTAIAATELCSLAKLRGSEEAFICGLLHDLGKLIFLKADAEFYTTVVHRSQEEGGLLAIEKKVFGFDHAKLGTAAAEAWHFPGPVCDIISAHHDPTHATGGIALTRIVSIADTLDYRKNQALDIDDLVSSEVVKGFGFTVEQLDEVWETTSVRLREIMRSFF
jgi:putative nucleotidyltransferase with HDIG domain